MIGEYILDPKPPLKHIAHRAMKQSGKTAAARGNQTTLSPCIHLNYPSIAFFGATSFEPPWTNPLVLAWRFDASFTANGSMLCRGPTSATNSLLLLLELQQTVPHVFLVGTCHFGLPYSHPDHYRPSSHQSGPPVEENELLFCII